MPSPGGSAAPSDRPADQPGRLGVLDAGGPEQVGDRGPDLGHHHPAGEADARPRTLCPTRRRRAAPVPGSASGSVPRAHSWRSRSTASPSSADRGGQHGRDRLAVGERGEHPPGQHPDVAQRVGELGGALDVLGRAHRGTATGPARRRRSRWRRPTAAANAAKAASAARSRTSAARISSSSPAASARDTACSPSARASRAGSAARRTTVSGLSGSSTVITASPTAPPTRASKNRVYGSPVAGRQRGDQHGRRRGLHDERGAAADRGRRPGWRARTTRPICHGPLPISRMIASPTPMPMATPMTSSAVRRTRWPTEEARVITAAIGREERAGPADQVVGDEPGQPAADARPGWRARSRRAPAPSRPAPGPDRVRGRSADQRVPTCVARRHPSWPTLRPRRSGAAAIGARMAAVTSLVDRWVAAVRGAGATAADADLEAAGGYLLGRWSEPQRQYHDVSASVRRTRRR